MLPRQFWLHRCGLVARLTFAAITVASGVRSAPAPTDTDHVVQRGETLRAIAHRYKVPTNSLMAFNGLSKKSVIQAGQKLAIPAPSETDSRAALPTASDKKAGLVHLVRGQETLKVRVLDRHRHLLPSVLPAFTRLMRSELTGATRTIDPRLITLVAMVSDHFKGRDIIVVSGFRPYSPHQYTPHSNHNVGRAIDFIVRGVPNTVLRDYCRTLRNTGVGYYPNSSFVHMDVRAASAYWVDYAGPGQRPRYDRPEEREQADEGAGEVPVQGIPTARFGGKASDEGEQPGSDNTQHDDLPAVRNRNVNSSASDSTGDSKVFPGR